MRNKFFISSDKKTVFNIDEIAAIKEDTKTDHMTYNKSYNVFLRDSEWRLTIDSETMIELLGAMAK